MDEAFRQHANPSRRKNLSSTHLDHLSLAPLTSRLPLDDQIGVLDDNVSNAQYASTVTSRSYLEGKSAPTTPGILARNHPRNPPRTPLHPSAAAAASLPKKSHSATALQGMLGTSSSSLSQYSKHRRSGSGTQTPTRHHHHRLAMTTTDSAMDRDWLEHTGALLSDSAREYKGQAWLVSRDSSTSLTGREEEEANKWGTAGGEPSQSRRSSASASRVASRMGSRVMTPLERGLEGGYFAGADPGQQQEQQEGAAGDSEWEPDFVNLDEDLEAAAVAAAAAGRAGAGGGDLEEDEAAIRSLVRNGNAGVGSWIGGMVGWPLFSVDEGEESSSEEVVLVDEAEAEMSRTGSVVRFEEEGEDEDEEGVVVIGGITGTREMVIPPPWKEDGGGGGGGWQDAAWLLSVASKVLV